MSGKIVTLYEDAAKTNGIYPRTKFNAVTNNDGHTLGNVASYVGETLTSGISSVDLKLDMDVLGVNASPTSTFAAQTIALNTSGYRYLYYEIITYRLGSLKNFIMAPIGNFTRLGYISDSSTSNYCVKFRDVTSYTSSIVFGEGKHGNNTTDNDVCIPYIIYGIK